MIRRGDWQNFSVLHILGVGVRQDAHLRSIDHFNRINHTIEDIEQKYAELADVRALMGSLRDRITSWRQDFLSLALSVGSDAFKVVIADESSLWDEAYRRYGTGVPGYKRDLASMWRDFFETAKPDSARAAVEKRLRDAWTSTIIEQLAEATRAEAVIGAAA
jgi:hypothetical protein